MKTESEKAFEEATHLATKTYEVSLFEHSWLVEVLFSDPKYSDDFDIQQVLLNHNGVTLDMSDMVDCVSSLGDQFSAAVVAKINEVISND